MSKKIVLSVLRFVSMLFKYLKGVSEKKNCPKYFEICEYAFSIFGKGV